MMSVYVLYECDSWLTYESLVPMGIFDNEDSLFKAASELINNIADDETEAEEMMREFRDIYQTQGFERNLHVKVVELNKLEEF